MTVKVPEHLLEKSTYKQYHGCLVCTYLNLDAYQLFAPVIGAYLDRTLY